MKFLLLFVNNLESLQNKKNKIKLLHKKVDKGNVLIVKTKQTTGETIMTNEKAVRFVSQTILNKISEALTIALNNAMPTVGPDGVAPRFCVTVSKNGKRASSGYWVSVVGAAFGSYSEMGSDGEYNTYPNCAAGFVVKTNDAVKNLMVADLDSGINFKGILSLGLTRYRAETKRRADYEAEKSVADAAEKVAKERVIDTAEKAERILSFNDAIETDDAIKLSFFRTDGVIFSNDYREEFLALVHNVEFQKLVFETIEKPKAYFDYDFKLKLGRETNRRKIEHFSIGGPKKAFDYLTKEWK